MGESSVDGGPGAPGLTWDIALADGLLRPPARWGWRAAGLATRPQPAAPPTPAPTRPPSWVDAPAPSNASLHKARSKAVTGVILRVALCAGLGAAYAIYYAAAKEQVSQLDTNSQQAVQVVVLIVAALLAISVLRALWRVRRATAALAAAEKPYRDFRAAERARHQEAMKSWEAAMREHSAAAKKDEVTRNAERNGPRWYPVRPVGEPVRVDVLGGDPRRHGWASFVATVGTAAIQAGGRVTVIDFTGQDVGGGLLRIGAAAGRSTQQVTLGPGSPDVDLLSAVPREQLPELLAGAVVGSGQQPEQRHERAFIAEALGVVIKALDDPLLVERIGAGVQVLRQAAPPQALTGTEVTRLGNAIGDLEVNEWTSRQLRFLASQLTALSAVAPGRPGADPLFGSEVVVNIATPAQRDDRKTLIDRLVLEATTRTLWAPAWRNRLLVVAGADLLELDSLKVLADHARSAGVRLVQMIEHPHGDLESIAGTGGAVCFMRMYNHKDAAVAAEFIGRGHKFVLNQITRQVGKSFTDGGGDNVGTNAGSSESTQSGGMSRKQTVSDSRGQTWAGSRSWSTSDNLGTSTSTGRVYEFTIEPTELMGMPETAFLLVDSSGPERQVVMADANPGICLDSRAARSG